jgi:hypothetical protein
MNILHPLNNVLSSADISGALRPYAEMGAYLFPGKAPYPGAGSFVHDSSNDPADWERWAREFPKCNWLMVTGRSQKIVQDVDVKHVGPVEADAALAEWHTSRGLVVPEATIMTPSGGVHIYHDTVETDLRQPSLIPGVIDIRAGRGFVIIPPSTIDGVPYRWASERRGAGQAPEALVDHCRPPKRRVMTGMVPEGAYDEKELTDLIVWMDGKGAFAGREAWIRLGMACKTAYGENGLALWSLSHDETVSESVEAIQWNSFASESKVNSVGLRSIFQIAHQLGWNGSIRLSTKVMFKGVAQLAVARIAAAAGATLLPPCRMGPWRPPCRRCRNTVISRRRRPVSW